MTLQEKTITEAVQPKTKARKKSIVKLKPDENPDLSLFDPARHLDASVWQVRFIYKDVESYVEYVKFKVALILTGELEADFWRDAIRRKLSQVEGVLSAGDFITPDILEKRVYKHFKIRLYKEKLYRLRLGTWYGFKQLIEGKHWFSNDKDDSQWARIYYNWVTCYEYFTDMKAQIDKEKEDRIKKSQYRRNRRYRDKHPKLDVNGKPNKPGGRPKKMVKYDRRMNWDTFADKMRQVGWGEQAIAREIARLRKLEKDRTGT